MKKYLFTYLIISLAVMLPSAWAGGFKQTPISDELFQTMQAGNTFDEAHSPVPKERLRVLTVKHIDFDGKTTEGQMVVLDTCAEAVLNIFESLYKKKFPICKMQLLHHYQGDDSKSMADNNTSSHNCRPIKNAGRFSLHAYGVAIDINPVQNPCAYIDEEAGTATYEPTAGVQYANRRLERLGKDDRQGMAEEVIDIFAQHGFYWWGGYWDTPIDYQHFQLSKSMTELYLAMEPTAAQEAFHKTTRYFNRHKKPLESVLDQQLKKVFGNEYSLAQCYTQNPELFNKVFKKVVRK